MPNTLFELRWSSWSLFQAKCHESNLIESNEINAKRNSSRAKERGLSFDEANRYQCKCKSKLRRITIVKVNETRNNGEIIEIVPYRNNTSSACTCDFCLRINVTRRTINENWLVDGDIADTRRPYYTRFVWLAGTIVFVCVHPGHTRKQVVFVITSMSLACHGRRDATRGVSPISFGVNDRDQFALTLPRGWHKPTRHWQTSIDFARFMIETLLNRAVDIERDFVLISFAGSGSTRCRNLSVRGYSWISVLPALGFAVCYTRTWRLATADFSFSDLFQQSAMA